MQNQRTANGHTLALTAGQFVRPRVLAIGKSHAAKQPDRFSLHLGLIAFLHEHRRHGDVAEHRFIREQIVALEHHADTRAQFTGPVGSSGSFRARLAGIDHLIVDGNRAALNRFQTGDGAQQRRLARAGRTQHHEHRTMLHLEGDVIQHRLVGIRILFDQMIHLETLAGRFGFSHSTTSFPVGGPQWTAASTR